MHVEITAIEQHYSLKEQRAYSYLVLTLPSGRNLSIEVPEDEVTAILEARVASGTIDGVPDPTGPSDLRPAITAPALSDDSIEWMTVPDEVLPPIVKAEFQQRQLPARMSVQEVGRLAREVLGPAFSQEEPPIGTVEHGVRLPGRHSDWTPPRIDTDEAGNPLVPQAAQDPGEIFDDETGARSI